MNHQKANTALHTIANPKKAVLAARFFKTGKGEYGEGDKFLGITVPEIRKIAQQFREMPIKETQQLLSSAYNEARLLALLILVDQYKLGSQKIKEKIVRSFLKHRRFANNWNLVDSSAPYILGAHLVKGDRKILYTLAKSKQLWDRRIAIVATLALIREKDLKDVFKLTEILLGDDHDLMHKACGWMLREAGKCDIKSLENFLARHHHKMPRTMLRYAIERLPEKKRKSYLLSTQPRRN